MAGGLHILHSDRYAGAHTDILTPSLPCWLQSLELYRQLGALLGRTNRWLADAEWDWRATSTLHREFDWNTRCLPATYARVRGRLLGLPSLDV